LILVKSRLNVRDLFMLRYIHVKDKHKIKYQNQFQK